MAADARRAIVGFIEPWPVGDLEAHRGRPQVAFRNRIVSLLATIAEAGAPDEKTMPAHQSYRLVRMARVFVDEHLTEELDVESLAGHLGVSARSLQRAFRSTLGVAPKRYILARKLDAARREILRCGSRTTIMDVAFDFGFVSPSRFAEQYRRQFGHAPSSVTQVVTPP